MQFFILSDPSTLFGLRALRFGRHNQRFLSLLCIFNIFLDYERSALFQNFRRLSACYLDWTSGKGRRRDPFTFLILDGACDAIVGWATVATSKKNSLAEGISGKLLASSRRIDRLDILQLLHHDAIILVDLSAPLPFRDDSLHNATFGQGV